MPSEETTPLLKAQATSQMKPIQHSDVPQALPQFSKRRKELEGKKYISYNRKPIFSITNSRMGWAYSEDCIILLEKCLFVNISLSSPY